MLNERKTVVVTAIGSFSAGIVIETCRREGYRVVGCDIYPAQWVVNSRDVDVFYQAPYATDRDAYREFLVQICKKEQASFLLPLTDVEIDVIHHWEQAEEEMGVTICVSGYDTISLCRDKRKMEQFLADKQICRTIPGRSLDEVMEHEAELGYAGLSYPVVLKPVDGRSSQGLRTADSAREMEMAVELCRDGAENYLVQPRISGMIVTVDVVRDPETGETVCLPRRELLRTLNGAGTSVCVFRDDALETQCRKLAQALGIRGCVNFEFVEHVTYQGDVEWYFLECNPRFSGGVAFSCMAGYDMVKNHLNCFEGRGIEKMGDVCGQYIARRYTEYRMGEE